jgi:hypothetical protein
MASSLSRIVSCLVSPCPSQFADCSTEWANNPGFPIGKPADQKPGLDALIGQNGGDGDPLRALSGTDPADPTKSLDLGSAQWVLSKGGEYFFAPSISTLKNVFGLQA